MAYVIFKRRVMTGNKAYLRSWNEGQQAVIEDGRAKRYEKLGYCDILSEGSPTPEDLTSVKTQKTRNVSNIKKEKK